MQRTRARRRETEYIKLDTHRCEACWKCIEACPENVLGRIRLPFHKHVRIVNPELCKGCLKCVKVCLPKAITPKRVMELEGRD